jgi:hypothetical protein
MAADELDELGDMVLDTAHDDRRRRRCPSVAADQALVRGICGGRLTRGGNATYPAPRPLVPIELEFCPGCNCFVREEETACPFCGGDLAALREEDQAHRRRRRGGDGPSADAPRCAGGGRLTRLARSAGDSDKRLIWRSG